MPRKYDHRVGAPGALGVGIAKRWTQIVDVLYQRVPAAISQGYGEEERAAGMRARL